MPVNTVHVYQKHDIFPRLPARADLIDSLHDQTEQSSGVIVQSRMKLDANAVFQRKINKEQRQKLRLFGKEVLNPPIPNEG